MTSWEYLQVTGVWHRGRSRAWWVNDEKLPREERIPITEYLNRLGEDGWELVDVQITEHHTIYWLKRQE